MRRLLVFAALVAGSLATPVHAQDTTAACMAQMAANWQFAATFLLLST